MFRVGAFLSVVLCLGRLADGAIVSPVSLNGNDFDDFSVPGLLSIDPNFTSDRPVTFEVTLESGDLPKLPFNSVVDLLFGADLEGMWLIVDGVAWDSVGTIDAGIGGITFQTISSTRILLTATGENDGFVLGDPFGTTGAVDWSIDLTSLSVGDSFLLTFHPVPEPSTVVLGIVGGLLLAGFRRRS
jgi:hypothetical protein